MNMDKMGIVPLLMCNVFFVVVFFAVGPLEMRDTYKRSRKYRIKSLIKKICVTELDNLP